MRAMLSRPIHERPAVATLPEAAFFKSDRLLRALRFMDSILQRDTAQKHAFVRDLPSFWAQFDKRILRLRVLPCLMHQWQDEAMRDAVLPLVLAMAQDLPADIFQNQVRSLAQMETSSDITLKRLLAGGVALRAYNVVEITVSCNDQAVVTCVTTKRHCRACICRQVAVHSAQNVVLDCVQVLPALKSILSTAQGAQLLEILRATPQLQEAMRVDQIEDTLVPVLLRGLAQADTRLQEEVLSSFKRPLQKIGGACLHGVVLPELMKACMRTKSGAVRCGALLLLVDVAARLTEAESNAIVRMIAKIASVDKSPSTLQHVLKVRNALQAVLVLLHARTIQRPNTSTVHPAMNRQRAITFPTYQSKQRTCANMHLAEFSATSTHS